MLSRLYCSQCYTRKSIRKDSFFDKSRLPLQRWVILMYMWVRQYPVTDACEEAEVGERTAIDVYQWLWEVCSFEWTTNNTWRPADSGQDRRKPLSPQAKSKKKCKCFIKKDLLHCSTIVAEQPLEKCGCLG